MASSGLMDVIVYTVTRRHLISDTEHSTTDRNYDYNTDSQWQTNITTTNGGEGTRTRKKGLRMGSRLGSKFRRSMPTVDKETRNSPFEDSTDDIVQKDDVEMANFGGGGVYQETTIEITHEPATPADTLEGGSRRSG
jgi:hypothetical protein